MIQSSIISTAFIVRKYNFLATRFRTYHDFLGENITSRSNYWELRTTGKYTQQLLREAPLNHVYYLQAIQALLSKFHPHFSLRRDRLTYVYINKLEVCF